VVANNATPGEVGWSVAAILGYFGAQVMGASEPNPATKTEVTDAL
jgi:hypothetical protein